MKISVITEILPVILYIFPFNKANDKRLRVIFFLIIVNMLSDSYGLYTFLHNVNNYVSYNLYIPIETLTLYTFFYLVISTPIVKKLILFSAIFFLTFWLYQYIHQGQIEFLDNCITIENISVLVICLYYYFEKIIKKNISFIYLEQSFWVVTAYLIFISGTFFLLLYAPTLDVEQQQKYWVLNYFFVIIRTILLSIAMLMKNSNSPKQKFKLT